VLTASNQASAVVTLKGPGTADVLMGGDALKLQGSNLLGANQELESITLSGTTAATSLLIRGRGTSRFSLNIGNISATTGALAAFQVKGATQVGDVSVPGGIHQIELDVAEDGSIDAGTSPTSIKGLSFVDENFNSTGEVRSVAVGQWADSDAIPETFSAAGVGKLTSGGSFGPDMQLTGNLGPAKIRGSIGGTWNVGRVTSPLTVGGSIGPDFNGTFGAMAGMTVKGAFNGTLTAPSMRMFKVASMLEATVNLTSSGSSLGMLAVKGSIGFTSILAAGSIGKVIAGALSNCRLYAGVSSASLPATPSDFSSPATIGSIILHPSRPGVISFDSARIAATNFGVLSLGTTRTANGGFQYGVGARSIGLLTIQDTTHPQKIKLHGVHDAATLVAQLSAQKVVLGDLTFQIV
jgi:hypothetical protein